METPNAERAVEIVNRAGMHARPAAEFVKLAGSFASRITIEKDGLEVNGKSIMGVLQNRALPCGSPHTGTMPGTQSPRSPS